jgi:two-component system chemotaxis response regulator CheB
VLSGVLDDGSAGAAAVAAHGGGVFVQDPKEALYQGMPLAAAEAVPDATVESLAELAGSIASFFYERAAEDPAALRGDAELERRLAVLLEPKPQDPSRAFGEFTGVHCPACGGPIYEAAKPEEVERYECVVGHSWGALSLLQGQREQMESALRLAAEQLIERVSLSRRLAEHAERGGRTASARMFSENAERTEQALLTIRQLLDRVRETLDGESVSS